MKLTVLVDNHTLIDRYFLGEPGVARFTLVIAPILNQKSHCQRSPILKRLESDFL